MKLRLLAAFACFALAAARPSHAQAPTPLFATSEPLRLTITAPLSGLIRNRDNRGSIAGTLTEPNGQQVPVSLQLRGITRRTADICDFPPLRVDFPTPPPAGSIFAGQRRLKLVTHCRNSASFQQTVLLEHAAYRMYNVLTPRSLRTRLATIDYREADGRPIISRVGFFIENLRDLAQRNGTSQVRGGERIPVSWLSPPDAARYALFQHMIGNHDWSMRAGPPGEDCCHNAELIGTGAPGSVIPVPYDFDFSGLVSAPYAEPPSELELSDVRQRLYRGYCLHNAEAASTARQMLQARPQLLAALTQTPGLDPNRQRTATAYLERFFAEIGNEAAFGSRVIKRCIG